MIEYVKMPSPLMVIGAFYVLVVAFYLYDFIKDGYWCGMWRSIIRTLTSYPKRIAIMFIILLLLVLFIDLPVTNLANDYYNQNFYTVVDLVNKMGEGWFIGVVIFSLFMIYQFFDKFKLAIVAKISLMASIYAGLFNAVIKIVINRERPSVGMNPTHFFHFFSTHCKNIGDLMYATNSMPSGHTITICAAVYPFLMYAKSLSMRLLIILPVVLISFARIYTLNHWFSDVFVSVILGTIIGRACYLCNSHYLLKVGK